jgi:uncharacterized protein YkwD
MKPILLSLAAIAVMAGCSTPSPRSAGKVVLSAQVSNSSTSQQLLELHNQIRQSNGLRPLQIDPRLSSYAQDWAESMAAKNSMKHSHLAFLAGSGYQRAAENIAAYQRTTTHVTESWLNSSGHRRNILDSRLRATGFGMARDAQGRPYWCAVFGG